MGLLNHGYLNCRVELRRTSSSTSLRIVMTYPFCPKVTHNNNKKRNTKQKKTNVSRRTSVNRAVPHAALTNPVRTCRAPAEHRMPPCHFRESCALTRKRTPIERYSRTQQCT